MNIHHYTPAPAFTHSSGFKSMMKLGVEITSWQSQVRNAIQTIQNGSSSLQDIFNAEQALLDLLDNKSGAYSAVFNSGNPLLEKDVKEMTDAVNAYFSTLTLHVDGKYIQGGYPGYDYEFCIYQPNAPDTPIGLSDFMNAVRSGFAQDVRLEWQDGQGDFDYQHGTMSAFYKTYAAHITVQGSAGSQAALARLKSILQKMDHG